MSEQQTPRTLEELAYVAHHQFYAPHFGLVDGLARRVEAEALALGVPPGALASHLLLTALDAREATEARRAALQAESDRRAGGTRGTAGPFAVFHGTLNEASPVFIPTPDPDPAAIAAHMVNLLNDEAFCAGIRELACDGAFGTVIRDVATALAARGLPS